MTFEYDITTHPAGTFQTLAYFCSEAGQCTLEQVQGDQIQVLKDLLNERGSHGWELAQIFFQSQGVIAFWKRSKAS